MLKQPPKGPWWLVELTVYSAALLLCTALLLSAAG